MQVATFVERCKAPPLEQTVSIHQVRIVWAFEVCMQTCSFGLGRVAHQQITKHQLPKPQQVLVITGENWACSIL